MSARFPGWRTLPGIEIAPLAAKAREQGGPVRHFAYVWDQPTRGYVSTCGFQVDGDGTVTLPSDADWEPLTEDGMLTGFRGRKSGLVEELVQVTMIVVPEGDPPWSPALAGRLPPEQIGMFRRGDAMADGIDIDAENPAASISVGFAAGDGSMTCVSWGITAESAASVIALIRERHGEPQAEFTTGSAEDFHEAAMGAVDSTGVFTCAHEREEP